MRQLHERCLGHSARWRAAQIWGLLTLREERADSEGDLSALGSHMNLKVSDEQARICTITNRCNAHNHYTPPAIAWKGCLGEGKTGVEAGTPHSSLGSKADHVKPCAGAGAAVGAVCVERGGAEGRAIAEGEGAVAVGGVNEEKDGWDKGVHAPPPPLSTSLRLV